MQLNPERTVYLIDGSSFLYRAYYGLRPMHTANGEVVQAVYGFARMLKKIFKEHHPQYAALVWDSKGPTERQQIFAEYKATRQAPPSDLFTQKDHIIDLANLIGLAQIAKAGIEADDLIYSLACDFKKQGYQVVLVTSDKDLFQLLDEQVVVLDTFKDQLITREMHEAKLGFGVDRIALYYAIVGDASDNIPGVRGIGQKGATELVQKFENLDQIYQGLDQVTKPKMRQSLIDHKTDAYLSFELFSLRYHALNLTLEDLRFDEKKWNLARDLFAKLEFKSLLKELEAANFDQPKPAQIEFFADTKGYRFLPIVTEIDLANLCSQIAARSFALDTETTGLDVFQSDLVGISICYEKGLAYYIPVAHEGLSQQLSKDLILKYLQPIFANSEIPKILHNTKFDQHVLARAGLSLAGVVFDTMLAANLLTEDWQRVGLKHLSERYLNERMLTYAEVSALAGANNFGAVQLDLAVKYAAADAHQTWQLYQVLQPELERQGQEKLFYEIEMPISQILFKMEQAGIWLNVTKLNELGRCVDAKISEVVNEIAVLTGIDGEFNLNSPRQVEDLLFNQLNLPPQKKLQNGYSTDQEVLDILAELHLVPKLILKYRELYKLKTTYIEALPRYVKPGDGKIHTSFSQVATATGRLASSEPNLQNIPVVGDGGQVRAAFEPSAGSVYLSADYSQIELRVLAYLSQDQELLQSFLNNEDIHLKTAVAIFNSLPKHVTPQMRQVGKRINFSVIYGLTPYGLSKDLKINQTDAKRYIEKFFAQYPGVQAWMDQVVELAKVQGYVSTFWGRKRYIPGIHERNKNLYEAARRVAINTVVQGTAAELVKLGMLKVARSIRDFDAELLLQIHDELLISVNEKQGCIAEKAIKDALESVVVWNIPLLVTTRLGYNWSEVSK